MTKKIANCILTVTLLLSACEEPREQRDLYNEMFDWSINIPENFERVNAEDWEKIRSRGLDAIEDSHDEEVQDRAVTIFTFRDGEMNYLESNYQPYDIDVDGPYLRTTREVNQILYKTFQDQLPNTTIDSSYSVEKISDLDFQTFSLKITFPNQVSLNSIMYSRLFNNKELTVNILYVDSLAGSKMKKVWQNSIF